MHELSLTQQLLAVVLENAVRAGAARVVRVHVVVGELSGVSGECINFYWSAMSAGTLAADATLHFRDVAFELRCAACGKVFAPNGEDYHCPACGGDQVRVAHGHECCIEAIDVEEPEAQRATC
ncbi:MAG: hydrogenase maturation nickel metallochaperone HypA [Phycisphaerales bacterium]